MLSPEEINELKAQLRDQIKNLPEEKRKQAESQINAMSSETLESMLKQQSQNSKKGIFRMLVDSEIPSKKVDENKDCIAVLDIKPISKGHLIIIPKKPIINTKDIPTSCFSLAKKLSKKITSKLKAKDTLIEIELKFGEVIINIIPLYDKPLNIDSPRTEESEEMLEKIYNELKIIKAKKHVIKQNKGNSQSNVIKLPRKIP